MNRPGERLHKFIVVLVIISVLLSNVALAIQTPKFSSPINEIEPFASTSSFSPDNTTYDGGVTQLYDNLDNLSISLDEMIPYLNFIIWGFNASSAELLDLEGEVEYIFNASGGCTICSNETESNSSISINTLFENSITDYEQSSTRYYDSFENIGLIHENVLNQMDEVRSTLEILEVQGNISHDQILLHDQAVQDYTEAFEKLNATLTNTSDDLKNLESIIDILKMVLGSIEPIEAYRMVNYNPDVMLTEPDFKSVESRYYFTPLNHRTVWSD